MATNPHIAAAMSTFRSQLSRYEKTERYYRGDHDLSFATQKFINAFGSLFREFSLNLCPAVVDSVRDKLRITEFSVERDDGTETANRAWEIWQANRMGTRAGQVHKEALKNGDAYAIVWPDDSGRPTIYPNRAANCMVSYDHEHIGRVGWAAKWWRSLDGNYFLSLFYADRVERYVARKRHDETTPGMMPSATPNVLPDATRFVPIAETSVVDNPYGIVPVFHFANNADMSGFGISELKPVVSIQDALNKSVLDMLVAMEFAAYRQRWAAGIEIELDDNGKPIPPFKTGIETLWISENADARFGDFDATDLKQFLDVKHSFRVDVATVSGTPLYYFMDIGGSFPSGESLKKSETRFINRVRDRMETFGQVWDDLMSFAMLIDGRADVSLFTQWEEPSQMSEAEALGNLVTKATLGIPESQLWMEAGYGEADIERMRAEKTAADESFVAKFNAGEV